MGLTFITSALSLFSYAFGSLSAVIGFFSANLVSSATIHSSDVTYLYVMRWLAVNKISTDSRLFCVTSRKNPQSAIVRRYSNFPGFGEGNRRHDDEDEDDDVGDAEDDSLGPKMKFSPAPGKLSVHAPFLCSLLCSIRSASPHFSTDAFFVWLN